MPGSRSRTRRATARGRTRCEVARLRLAPVGETMFPPRAPFFVLMCVGEPPGSPTPPPRSWARRPMSLREQALTELGERRFDLLVIGGGVVGAGIAEAAAAHGLAVAVVDKGDFGSATSSASSKLIHGGLRYLRLGDVR